MFSYMLIERTGQRRQNQRRMTEEVDYWVAGNNVTVHLSEEVVDDHGESAALAMAERKLAEAIRLQRVPKEVLVTNYDFFRH